jgi:hypothetical protein
MSTNETSSMLEQAPTPVELPASTIETVTDTVCLFTLDGKEYHVPAKPRAAIAVRYLRNVKRMSADYAAAALLEELLGVDGFDALCDYDTLTSDQFKAILVAAQKLAMGSFEEVMGGNSPGSSR